MFILYVFGEFFLTDFSESLTDLFSAVKTGKTDEIQRLLTSMEGEEILVDWLKNYRDNYGSGVLFWAVKNSDQEAIQLLLKAGAEPDETNTRGETPLLTSLDQGNEDLIRIFLEAGADTEKKDFAGNTPLTKAVSTGNVQIVEMLFVNDHPTPDLEERNGEGYTPLLLAVDLGHLEIVEYLLDKGADFLKKNSEGRTILHLTALHNDFEILDLFLEKKETKTILEDRDADGNTALLLAASHDSVECLEKLLKIEANFLQVNASGKTGLEEAERQKYHHVSKILRKVLTEKLFFAAKHGEDELCRTILKLRISPNPIDQDGNTPLHIAVIHDRISTAQLLLDLHASQFLKNLEGKSALDIAKEKKKEELIQLLEPEKE
ncbi:ankyrin repeat domain-containing protein [Leptospira borgpetersenii]|nr:ankyrin repeat domain-containing protein [Leptospira borgpetersenii serovar Tarassovi]UVA65545.1 ankyrin repeat domain-containing protein [Leptospira borgpetersenii]MBE8404580.1 ankyrin repeat domain-containing protein [Leptospira borgpetersenii serovar Tarassovi]MBE8407740.1 ankyrin repeat domain-containing protein [Leptospira borgpetersenii serovar Tarassovi]MBE8414002.1 ankyrin repeat domain-containing protein [Leptospira borgpetersenii serovar Tarassovi]